MSIEWLEEYAGRLEEVYGGDLVSIALYGSAARGDYREGVSDVNLLVVLRRLDAERLRAGSALALEWVAAGNPPPLMMSEEEWRESADVFPIEYSDIREAHRVVRGAEIFEDLEIGWADLRLQLEREMKEKKIQLRERYLVSASAPEELGELLLRSFPSFLALFRGALRLTGDPVPREPEAVIRAFAERSGIEPGPWLRVAKAREEAERLSIDLEDPLAAGYLDGVARAAAWLDTLDGGPVDGGV